MEGSGDIFGADRITFVVCDGSKALTRSLGVCA